MIQDVYKRQIKGSGNKFGKVLYYLTKIEGNETLENKGIARIQDEMIDVYKRQGDG